MKSSKLAILLLLAGATIGCGQQPDVSHGNGNGSGAATKPEQTASGQDAADSVDELSIKPKSEVGSEAIDLPNTKPSNDSPPPAASPEESSFVAQTLTPFTAEVERPKDWFYHENHRGPSYTWIISKEDTKGGQQQYETGVQIQAFFGVKENTTNSPEDFVADFLTTRRQTEGVTTLQEYEERAVGPFKLITLATEEGGNRIVHTCYWGDGEEFDVVVVIIRGTKKELWAEYRPVFQNLSTFDLRLLVGGARKSPEPK